MTVLCIIRVLDDRLDARPQDRGFAATTATRTVTRCGRTAAQTIVCLLPGPHGLSQLHDTVSLVVVDPVCGGRALVTNISHLLSRQPAWPILVYTVVTPTSLQIIATLGRQGLREVALTPYDDSPERFARTLWRMATTARDAHP